MDKRIVFIGLIVIMLFSACAPQPSATNSSSIPTVDSVVPAGGACSIPTLTEFGDEVLTSCTLESTPLPAGVIEKLPPGFTVNAYSESMDGNVKIWWQDPQMMTLMGTGLGISQLDTPLPGPADIVAIITIGVGIYVLYYNATHPIVTTSVSGLNGLTLTLPTDSEAVTITSSAATLDGAVMPWPEAKWRWRVPEWNWEDGIHASMHRHWPVLFVMLAYLEVTAAPDGAYFGTASGRFVLTKQLSGLGMMAIIFDTYTFAYVASGGTNVPVPQVAKMVTAYYDSGPTAREKIRFSNCSSWQLFPAIGYEPQYEPPTMGGIGRCFQNNNVAPGYIH